jgi:catechol 2,3-dioxygenase-like lactoylglutathione lyase family enzyme
VIIGLDHVQIAAPAGCEERARAFYGELLGLAQLPKPAALAARGGVWFELRDGRQLHVGVAAPFAPARKAHPAFRAGVPGGARGARKRPRSRRPRAALGRAAARSASLLPR